MSFEQIENNKREEKKRKKIESKKTQEFFLEKKLQAQTSKLLEKLAQDIAQEFGIDVLKVKELISGSTLGNLDSLKTDINVLDFKNAIGKAKKSIEQLAKKQIESLKEGLEKNKYSPEKFEYKINKKLFGKEILSRVQNPQKFSDQVLGIGLGLIDSTEAVILFTYSLGKGILLTPYHIYLLIIGKAKYDGASKI